MPFSALQQPPQQTSVTVAVRVRPCTSEEQNMLVSEPLLPFLGGDEEVQETPISDEIKTKYHPRIAPSGLRKTINVVDDRMLVFDPLKPASIDSESRNSIQRTGPKRRGKDRRFVFDHVFHESATQEEVYKCTTSPLLDRVLDGENATVLAYGATGCGKTHTISGSDNDPGIVFQTMKELFQKIKALEDTQVVAVRISFLEIYNEMLRDLLVGDSEPPKLTLLEDANQRISLSGLSTHTPKTVREAMLLLERGTACRTSSPTAANAASSRSHAVLQIHVSSHSRTASLLEEHTYATLSIVDLAGSERAAATKNRGLRLHEGATINRSLLALGSCIHALSDPRKRGHVPWRNSKLTRLLKFSLGGNCRTVMVACVSPSSRHYDDTWNTLQYAQRAQAVSTSVSRNRRALDRHVASYVEALAAQKAEIDELRSRETAVVNAAVREATGAEERCLQMIRDCVSSLKASLKKPAHDRWRRCFSLAKRKLLLLHLTQLQTVTDHVHNSRNIFGGDSHSVSHPVRRFAVQAEQLQRKISEQILTLERFYETPSETDKMLAESVEHRFRKCSEVEGWASRHSKLLNEMASSLREHSQHDLLVQSSVLFDFLVGQVPEYAYLCQVLCSSIDCAQEYRHGSDLAEGSGYEETLNSATIVLEKMNDSDYDIALEAAAARFFHETNDGFNGAKHQNGLDDLSPDLVPASAMSSPIAGLHKRASRSPLRNTPAAKRSARTLKLLDESDSSMDTSEQDGSIMHGLTSPMGDFSVLDSPSIDKKSKSYQNGITGSRVGSSPFVQTSSEYVPRNSLLNKSASLKILDANSALKQISADADRSMDS